MLHFVFVVLSVAAGALVWAEKPTTSSTPTIVKLWPKDQMPGRGLKGPEKELPSRGDNVIRITDINEPSIAVYRLQTRVNRLPQ